MNRRYRTAIVVGLAVVMAGLASFGIYRAIQRIPVREVEIATSYVVVATQTLPTGTRLTTDDVRMTAWPARSPVPGAFVRIEDVVNRGLIASLVENEPLTESKLAPIEAGAGLPPSIPPGMRAISVKVNEVIGVAGFVVPGTRVDLTVTVRQQHGDSMSRIVVSNVQVLTAGTRYDQEKAKDGKPMQSTVVTLMVVPEDAERIALAATEGQIILALRNPLDVEPTRTQGIRLAGLMGQPSVQPAPRRSPRPKTIVIAAPTPAPAPPPVYTVEAIRASKRTEETVKQ